MMKKLWVAFKNEFQSRILSSKKRLIKFIGITLVPILYAIICILAFWNPLPGIGKAPIGILDQDETVYLYTNYNLTNPLTPQIEVGALVYDHDITDPDGQIIHHQGDVINANDVNYADLAAYWNGGLNTGKTTTDTDLTHVKPTGAWLLLKQFFNEKDIDAAKDESTIFTTPPLSDQKIAFTNIRYLKGQKAVDQYRSNSFYVELLIPHNFIVDLATYLDSTLSNFLTSQTIAPPDTNLQIWSTFERNFIFGYYLNTLNEFKESIAVKILDQAMANLGPFAKITQLPETFASIIDVDITGSENAVYGIGLGEFFLLIGMYVGVIVQTFVFDRAKRTKKTNAVQYYLSKTLLMMFTGFIQVSLLTATAIACGWHQIDKNALGMLYLWLILAEMTFVITIQAIWFAIKDETIGKFLCIVYMVLNLAAGWGTFPSFMQFEFFTVISNITEFTYVLHGVGTIVFGIGETGFNLQDSIYMLQQFGILLLFISVFMAIGLLCAPLRNKEMLYGSYKAKLVAEMLEKTNHTELLAKFAVLKTKGKFNKKGEKVIRFKYNWKAFEKYQNFPELVYAMRKLHPYEGQFKWFKSKQHDQVLKPNYSDEEVMSRNDEIEV